MPIDISPIIAGNAQLYYSDSEMFEPDLVRAFRKAVNANFTDTIVQAELTRSATGSTIWAAEAQQSVLTAPGQPTRLSRRRKQALWFPLPRPPRPSFRYCRRWIQVRCRRSDLDKHLRFRSTQSCQCCGD